MSRLPLLNSRLWPTLLTLLAFGLRVWRLDAKGLAYDEAATALMARAALGEIARFHWTAGFEHPPLWQLLMHGWSLAAGQNEAALRLLPALAGALCVPLAWAWLARLFPEERGVALLAALLMATGPALLLYGQEARMYTLVLALALASLWAAWELAQRPRWGAALALVACVWLMTMTHYYSALLVAAQAAFCAAALLWRPWAHHRPARPGVPVRGREWALVGGAFAVAALPLALWATFAPGFQQTLGVVSSLASAVDETPALAALGKLWRDLTFGAVRRQPPLAWVGYIYAPLALLGLADLLWPQRGGAGRRAAVLYLALVLLGPIALSLAVFDSLAARYILYVTPALYALAALGIVRLWRWAAPLGWAGLALALAANGAGAAYYYGSYLKSDYRTMAAHLNANFAPGDALLLEAPRQHLLAKYYVDSSLPLYPVPSIELPAYWPVTAPPVVPEEVDGEVQSYLAAYPALWLSLTAQDEVDPGEFLHRYLRAVAYEVECRAWEDVDLCRFASPTYVTPLVEQPVAALFGGELALQGASFAVLPARPSEVAALLAQLDWKAEAKPTVDYKASLKLLSPAGEVVSQVDDFPIGPLLPPTTWNEGDEKPGYFALPLPAELPPGELAATLAVYDPATLAPSPRTLEGQTPSTEPLVLAKVRVGDTIELLPAGGE